mmetsp:Transcript_35436/g.34468  ORF Transcript_35436/g.34468 Transcript_35436/m.34468 type:complete len:91 (-) Transcript_35436:367-639(-)|eukprot:CAMPEP_0170563930 /NCGR_PEP_ID=MMETSP0211-20121228/69867_1 /TAXON_ID=311385 /ORGANISM="Pseudokeronopsis sp., Strain OXSARD2" /LENGTH=90 /DNA_ID=CAMNT_0010882785 /DNA_START=351 /DNA_END=623 /DNA_ORIENTATION=+
MGKDKEHLELERQKVRNISSEIFQMKISKHFDKLKEIFGELATKESRGNGTPQIKLKKIFRYLDDLAYIIGMVFIDYRKYLSNAGKETKS